MTVRFIADDVLEALGGAGEVVRRRDDRPAAGGLGLEEVHQVLLRRDVDAGHRLVEEVQVRLRPRGPGRGRRGGAGRRTASRSGSGRDPPMPTCSSACGDGVAVRRAGPAERAERADSGPSSRRPRRSPGSPSRRSPPGARRRPAGPRRRAARRARRTVPGPRLEQAGDDLEQRGLAAAVRPEDRDERARPELDVDVADRGRGRRSPR